jgi:carbonic anhydrase/acetyltransferase-like protein (isoleucine patch superfamily)
MSTVSIEEMVRNLVIGFQPELVHPSVWIAPTAVVTGTVHIGAWASVWYGAVLRGDVASITIGPRTNVQDGCIVHVDYGKPTVLGSEVVMGHGAVVHAATIEDGCLIAMRATILSGARIGEGSIIGAGAVVKEGAQIPPRSLVMGVPGRVLRHVSDGDAASIRKLAERYVACSRSYRRHDEGG